MSHFTRSSEENYLKELYKLGSKASSKVNNIALAKAMALNPATVLEMVRKLGQKGLLEALPDKSIRLTDKGKKIALLTIRKHRLWEVFLVEQLGYRWNEVHDIAEQLEHIESASLIDRLEKFLGYPALDPHGDPIPDRQGRIKAAVSFPLSEGAAGKAYLVVNLADTHDAFLQYLDKVGLRPGVKVNLKEQNDYDGSWLASVGKKSVQLSEKVASNIRVRPA